MIDLLELTFSYLGYPCILKILVQANNALTKHAYETDVGDIVVVKPSTS